MAADYPNNARRASAACVKRNGSQLLSPAAHMAIVTASMMAPMVSVVPAMATHCLPHAALRVSMVIAAHVLVPR
jgi:hypothetical protein